MPSAAKAGTGLALVFFSVVPLRVSGWRTSLDSTPAGALIGESVVRYRVE